MNIDKKIGIGIIDPKYDIHYRCPCGVESGQDLQDAVDLIKLEVQKETARVMVDSIFLGTKGKDDDDWCDGDYWGEIKKIYKQITGEDYE